MYLKIWKKGGLHKKHGSHLYKLTQFSPKFFFFFSQADIKEKQQKAPKPCCCIWEYKYIAAPEVHFHHQVSVARYWVHSHSCNLLGSVSTSLPTFPQHTWPATSSSSKLSPLPPPCQHTDSTTPHNSKTSLTFSPTSRNSRYNRVKLF